METTVLIADDHPLFREALRLVVAEALGPTAITLECASLHEAREQVELHPGIELALMDLNIPGMDGLAGLASLRARMPTLPIIVVSADERHATVDAALRAGVSGFIPKSFSRADMAAAVNAVLEGDIFFPATTDTARLRPRPRCTAGAGYGVLRPHGGQRQGPPGLAA